jgi:hypothetical protein
LVGRTTLGAPTSVIVNQAFVEKYLGKENPPAKQFGESEGDANGPQNPGYEIIGVVRDTKYNSNQLVQSARVTITICDVSVRCTGHLFAISSSFDRCPFVNDPLKWRSRSIRSNMPSLVSHSAQSKAWIFECRRLTATSSSGHRFRRAYIPTVIDVQAPNAASRKS